MDEADRPTTEHRRPEGLDDATVEALGKLSEALEVVEDARGHLYGFHRLTGMADLALEIELPPGVRAVVRVTGHPDLHLTAGPDGLTHFARFPRAGTAEETAIAPGTFDATR